MTRKHLNLIQPNCLACDDERSIRYHAKRRGYYVSLTRGAELKRPSQAGIGAYLLIDQSNNCTILLAATLDDLADFIETYDKAPRRVN